jgi:SAM-dependent methyltransferase
MTGPQYWNDRLERYGHTGWSNPAVYAYDQFLRLAAIERMLELLPAPAQGAALDFGCGVGDFCTMLSRHYSRVTGFDISARILATAERQNPGQSIDYTDDLDTALSTPRDLILSVTVLQHLVDNADVIRLLPRWAAALRPGGRVVAMESLADRPLVAGYLKRRTLEEVVGLFRGAGLRLLDQRTFYHPTEAPTRLFRRFRSSLLTRLLARGVLWRVPLLSAPLVRRARRAATLDTEYFDTLPSPTKILTFGRD